LTHKQEKMGDIYHGLLHDIVVVETTTEEDLAEVR
jgi:hypothetical protein